ncbi:glucose-6-phosphate dehydrogenase [Verminephrobacter aporrectodeae]|uniref:Glucose-6-phosphate 1-dehydrogenase n=1 Tax=Verminephrobacter aporrectodeae subsp. tuberculatae TaxID=1110392 RepID=A0ABT3KPN8_9BURK|nr:glucose-6-phosphate dehydrogenase [Verminephrobacter aporrectodeae]MCW5220777.1 glucose-6-phosphate dehydrogenase [Verminephrobacter aporrectodeae subsp. tuberculatae]MCW5255261.1 glucose-6-phosphate dehydrogenase [Verminephrobacter aporrectodeae subsp. tuberculatae]MCW5290072.1 glucose-6-phosphate dehydrogenase [Verminephrobacter aporrectodeae subsp. tuberculatae]MCW5320277.1 glucose-6-phosphate dehydrogenase [Verminephrobacter aporrectodeae subsp. tuberculatae]MCW8164040.1 glucose-6-phosp
MGFDLVLFGGTGDLAWRKLMPALFQAFRHGTLPPGGRIIAVARDTLSDERYRSLIQSRFDGVELAKRPTPDEFARFAALLHYLRMDLSQAQDYERLAQMLNARAADSVVMYLAIAPSLFTTVCEQIAAVGLNGPATRVVLEKPLGHDLQSNQAINDTLRRVFGEEQVFRIDHYLGKPSVQNLFALRFGNALFEPLWRRETIANIQISIAEDLGVETRGAFYDQTGALRDMVQNHALQLLCAIGMEPPINSGAHAIRDEKLKVLQSLKPWTAESIGQQVIRGQYAAGTVQGQAVAGYWQEKGVAPDSRTETFVALRTEILNWRWAGVPFYIRTGKRLAGRDAHIVVNFRPVPHPIFKTPAGAANRLVINLQPRDGLELHLLAQGAAQHQGELALSQAHLNLDFEQRFGTERVGAYERLLLDVIAARLNLFVRSDEQAQAWHWVEPILQHWKNDPVRPRPYAAGSWGPSAASAMIARDGHCWSEEV